MVPSRHIGSSKSIKVWFEELITKHETLYFLIWKDLKVQYGNFILGLLWSVFQPILYFGAIVGIFSADKTSVNSNSIPFPVFIFSGIIIWNFFTNAVNGCVSSIQANAGIISKSYFPRYYLVLSPFIRCVLDLLISSFLLLLLAIFTQSSFSNVGWWSIPMAAILLFLTTLGLATVATISVVYNRHMRHGIPMLLYTGLFLLPVFHAVPTIKFALVRILYQANPLAVAIRLVRSAFGNQIISVPEICIATIAAFSIFIFGILAFRRFENTLADRI